MALLKGIGIGLIIGAVWSFFASIPVVGSYLVGYQLYIMLAAGVVLFFMDKH